MRIVKWIAAVWLVLLFAAFLHYYLPGHDVVRIVGTDVKRMDVDDTDRLRETGAPGAPSRDVRFINGLRPNGETRVYRNEDTDWGFPFYFKFDSSNLQAEAQGLISTEAEPTWVIVRHYGWRITFISMFPNAMEVWRAEGPGERVIPWFNIIFFAVFGATLIAIIVAVRRFKERRDDPLLEDIGEDIDEVSDSIGNRATGVVDWFRRLIGKPPPYRPK
ncbi:MAG: DUF1523 family protein [Pseudomonadota bacterium]